MMQPSLRYFSALTGGRTAIVSVGSQTSKAYQTESDFMQGNCVYKTFGWVAGHRRQWTALELSVLKSYHYTWNPNDRQQLLLLTPVTSAIIASSYQWHWWFCHNYVMLATTIPHNSQNLSVNGYSCNKVVPALLLVSVSHSSPSKWQSLAAKESRKYTFNFSITPNRRVKWRLRKVSFQKIEWLHVYLPQLWKNEGFKTVKKKIKRLDRTIFSFPAPSAEPE